VATCAVDPAPQADTRRIDPCAAASRIDRARQAAGERLNYIAVAALLQKPCESLAPCATRFDHTIQLSISFCWTNHVKTGMKVVKSDRKTKKVVRIDRKLTASEIPGCYV
jgi:hypothetical protein